jgi:phytoene desaturase
LTKYCQCGGVDPAYRACFADGSTIHLRYGREAMRDEIAKICGSRDATAFDVFVDWLRQLYLLEMANFIDRNYDSPLVLLSSPRALACLMRLGAFGRLGAAVRERFTDRRLHRLFSFQAMYAGLPLDSALALCAVITYMDTIEGVWFPEGGINAVPMIMAQVAEKAGVTFRYGEAADAVLRSPTGRVAGVRTASGERIIADATVCTLDLPTAYEQPLSNLGPPRVVHRGQYSPSAVVWHVGVRGVPDQPVAHHNIHFGTEWSTAFDALLKQGMAAGTPFALADTFGQSGLFRPSNVERPPPGMFFAGSGTVPGVGVPMVLISGKLAASRVAAYLNEARQ